MTDTPTTRAWLLVQGASDERTHLGAVFGDREDAQRIANDMNAERMREAFEAEDTLRRVLPVGVLSNPVPAHLFAPLALHQGDRVRVTDSRTLAAQVGIVAKASDDELVVGIHAEDNGPGRGIAGLAHPLHRALHRYVHGEDGHERLRVFQGAPELTKRLDALLEAYTENVGTVPDPDDLEAGFTADELAEIDDELESDPNSYSLREHLDGSDIERIRVVDESGAYLRGVLARLPDGEIIVRVPQIVTRYGPRAGHVDRRAVVEQHSAVEVDGGDAYVGPPRFVATARFVVAPYDWAKYAPGNLTGDADGFATYVAGVVENAVTGDLVMSSARVGHAVRIESGGR